jgi:hypothetical protein
MHIDYLCDHPHLIEELAELNFKEWGEFRDGDTLEARTERMRAACGKGAVPSVVVAIEDGRLLGGALLIDSDMKIRPQLTPWLAGVYEGRRTRTRDCFATGQRIVAEGGALGVRRCICTPMRRKHCMRGWVGRWSRIWSTRICR